MFRNTEENKIEYEEILLRQSELSYDGEKHSLLERQDISRFLLNHEYVDLHYDCLGGLTERYLYVETGAFQQMSNLN